MIYFISKKLENISSQFAYPQLREVSAAVCMVDNWQIELLFCGQRAEPGVAW